MLTLNPDTVLSIIDMAHEFQVKESVTSPERSLIPTADWEPPANTGNTDDPARAALQTEIEDLEPDQQVELVALTWLGRGDYSIEEWQDAIEPGKRALEQAHGGISDRHTHAGGFSG